MQLTGDLSYAFGAPDWIDIYQTRLGIRGTWRSLDQYSPRFCPTSTLQPQGTILCNPLGAGDDGSEWEIRTYLHFVLN